jgi:hypothetical protein
MIFKKKMCVAALAVAHFKAALKLLCIRAIMISVFESAKAN